MRLKSFIKSEKYYIRVRYEDIYKYDKIIVSCFGRKYKCHREGMSLISNKPLPMIQPKYVSNRKYYYDIEDICFPFLTVPDIVISKEEIKDLLGVSRKSKITII